MLPPSWLRAGRLPARIMCVCSFVCQFGVVLALPGAAKPQQQRPAVAPEEEGPVGAGTLAARQSSACLYNVRARVCQFGVILSFPFDFPSAASGTGAESAPEEEAPVAAAILAARRSSAYRGIACV